MRQRDIHHGTSATTVPGAAKKKTIDPSTASTRLVRSPRIALLRPHVREESRPTSPVRSVPPRSKHRQIHVSYAHRHKFQLHLQEHRHAEGPGSSRRFSARNLLEFAIALRLR